MAETLGFPVPLRQRFRPLSITCPGFLTTCGPHAVPARQPVRAEGRAPARRDARLPPGRSRGRDRAAVAAAVQPGRGVAGRGAAPLVAGRTGGRRTTLTGRVNARGA